MKTLLPFFLLLMGVAPVDHPRTYLLSIGRLPIETDETIEAFSIKTWGVTVNAVCRIPSGWRITAGSSATPDGEISGSGSQGTTWLGKRNPPELQRFILVTLYGPVQRQTIGTVDNGVPATFLGSVTMGRITMIKKLIGARGNSIERPLSYRNVTLTPAHRCPG